MKYIIDFVTEIFESIYNENNVDKIKLNIKRYNNKEKILILNVKLRGKRYDLYLDFNENNGYIKENDNGVVWQGVKEELIDYLNHILEVSSFS